MDASVSVKAAETVEMDEEHVSGPGRERFCIACVSGRGPLLHSPTGESPREFAARCDDRYVCHVAPRYMGLRLGGGVSGRDSQASRWPAR
jgi:hypothetical protein